MLGHGPIPREVVGGEQCLANGGAGKASFTCIQFPAQEWMPRQDCARRARLDNRRRRRYRWAAGPEPSIVAPTHPARRRHGPVKALRRPGTPDPAARQRSFGASVLWWCTSGSGDLIVHGMLAPGSRIVESDVADPARREPHPGAGSAAAAAAGGLHRGPVRRAGWPGRRWPRSPATTPGSCSIS